MSEQEPPAPPAAEEKVTVNVAAAEAEAAADPTADDATPRKRRTPSPRTPKAKNEGDDTESEPEKQPKKKAKRGPKPGRKKKAVEPEASDARAVEKKVAALSDEVKSRFGQIGWAKMGGYPYWPCIITDPRLLPRKLQEPALKVLETKYLVFFYVSNNFAPISFKKIESWEDNKFNYREGYPEKDSKAPKRRVKLMAAIEVADKEVKLPIEERADGLLKPEEKTEAAEQKDEPPAPVKRKPGRPRKSDRKPLPKKTPKPRAPKVKDEKDTEQPDEKEGKGHSAAQEEEEDTEGPTLSKEEIKAKVASRKTPKKKGPDDNANAAGATAKKAPKPTAKHGKSNGSAEIDSKRKKEIELVVPHKTVKSADIREMTEEAAKKKLSGPKSKTKKDKGEYKVGDLASFASKMARLQAKESARNNDELVGMMQELFKETRMFRSDVERSGLAAIIAMLRKSLSPTVGKTASALRKHMMQILNNDTDIPTHLGKKPHQDGAGHANKKRKAENGSTAKSEEHQPKSDDSTATADNSDGKDDSADKVTVSSPPANVSPMKKAVKSEEPSPKDAAAVKTEEEQTSTETISQTAKTETVKPASSEDVAMKSDDIAEKTETATVTQLASPQKVEVKPTSDVAKEKEDMFEASEHLDRNRAIFVDMLSKILDHKGSKRADLAKEIENALFERFKEATDDYLTQARIIIFGLKENSPMRERLYSGHLHCLEFAYADDAFFKPE